MEGTQRWKSSRWKEKTSSLSDSEKKGTWSRPRSIKSRHKLSALSSEKQLKAPLLLIIHVVNVSFAEALDYRSYQLHHRSLHYNGKMATSTARLTKHMETITKPCQLDIADPVTALSILGQFKRVFDSNRVSEGAAVWNFPFFMTISPAASLTIRLTLREDFNVLAIVFHYIEVQECIYTFVEAVKYLLNSYTTDDVFANASSEIKLFNEFSNRTAIQYAKTLEEKALRCGNAYFEQLTRSIFVQILSRNVRDNMSIYWAAKPTMHLCQLAHYANTARQLDGNKLSSSTTSQPSSIRPDSQRDRLRNQARNISGKRRNKGYALMARLHKPLTNREKSAFSGTGNIA